ncbi:MAG: NADH:ubiquinone oxidoreductase subunit J [Robiginitomaculum sp.]|nr:MAG: NADH:ubiquinone oxidoreductase subunit J [Robiginitomaculum sp.]
MEFANLLPVIAFYLFAGSACFCALMVVIARNPVRSVLFLVATFFSVAALFVMLGAEFLAMLLVVVYVGAVAVLFLFVVMMLDVDFVELKQGFAEYLPLGGLLAFVLTVELIVLGATFRLPENVVAQVPIDPGVSNLEAFGLVLYTEYAFFFEAAGLILLVAMIGAILLTLTDKKGVKRQSVSAQVARTPKDGLKLVDVKPGEGII